jgi:acetyl-CoA carboxylase, biotin carboxylase subunit
MPTPIKKILIANRGEIAIRIMRACQESGIVAVAVFSDCDRAAYHVRVADEAYYIGPSPAQQSYLVIDNIIAAAKESGADAIHPGYGFLAENAGFAQRCLDEGIIFIGPKPETITSLGDKLAARAMALKAGLPVVPGTSINPEDFSTAQMFGAQAGYPILVKAAAGGGGKGMRVVESGEAFKEALAAASREAMSAFGDGRVFLEKYLPKPRHIEIQILCDQHGNCIHLGERECSIQRRHQKVIEESPSVMMTAELRERMGQAALGIARASGYIGVGTVEFLVDEDLSFYFLEVNTRLQVEHPVTEMVTGIDLVQEQIAVAEGRVLTLKQEDIKLQGHVIECRIYAEDPDTGFLPSTGKLYNYRIPAGPGVRVDSGVLVHSEIPVYYDPMMAKLLTWGRDRTEALSRMKRALEEYRVSGVKTTISSHQSILQNERFIRGDFSTRFLTEEYPDNDYSTRDELLMEGAAIAAAVEKLLTERRVSLPGAGPSDNHPGWIRFHRERALRRFGGSR